VHRKNEIEWAVVGRAAHNSVWWSERRTGWSARRRGAEEGAAAAAAAVPQDSALAAKPLHIALSLTRFCINYFCLCTVLDFNLRYIASLLRVSSLRLHTGVVTNTSAIGCNSNWRVSKSSIIFPSLSLANPRFRWSLFFFLLTTK